MCHALAQGIRTILTFIKKKSATIGKFITHTQKKQQVSGAECWDHCDKIKIIRLLASTNHILQKISSFGFKTEVLDKIKLFFVSKIKLVLRFMIRKKFYYVQTA